MDKNSQEALAIRMIFNGNDALSVAMRSRIANSVVVDRENTIVGFYSIIKLVPPLEAIHDAHQIWARNFSFNYPSLPHGGSFNCAFESLDQVEIEGVTFGNDIKWPNMLDPNLISEIL